VWLKNIYKAQELTPKVTAVNSAKHFDSDTETVCSLKRISMYITWSIKTSQVALYTVELRNTQHRNNMLAVLTVGILWRISERVVTKLITSHRWFVSALCLSIDLANRTYCSLGSIEYSSVNEQLHFSNSGKINYVFLSNHGVRASLWLLQWWPLKFSIVSQMNPVHIPILIALKYVLYLTEQTYPSNLKISKICSTCVS